MAVPLDVDDQHVPFGSRAGKPKNGVVSRAPQMGLERAGLCDCFRLVYPSLAGA